MDILKLTYDIIVSNWTAQRVNSVPLIIEKNNPNALTRILYWECVLQVVMNLRI